MDHQQTLFDQRPAPELASARPPAVAAQTSRGAAEGIQPLAGRMRRAVFEFVRSRGDEGATDFEVREALGLLGDTCRARRCELRDAGLIRDSGRRRPAPSGRAAVVWIADEIEACAANEHSGGRSSNATPGVVDVHGPGRRSRPIPKSASEVEGQAMPGFNEWSCQCGRRLRWFGELADCPACPACGRKPPAEELAAADREMEEMRRRLLEDHGQAGDDGGPHDATSCPENR